MDGETRSFLPHVRCLLGVFFHRRLRKFRRGCLLSNRQVLVFKRSCLLVSFFGMSWVGAQTFPCVSSGPSTDGHTQSSCTCWVHQKMDLPVRTLTFRYPCASSCLPFGGDAHFLLTLVVYAITGTERPSCFFVYGGFMVGPPNVSFLGSLFGVRLRLPACGWRFGSGPGRFWGRCPSPPVSFFSAGSNSRSRKGTVPKTGSDPRITFMTGIPSARCSENLVPCTRNMASRRASRWCAS